MRKLPALACLSAGLVFTLWSRPATAALSIELAAGTAVTIVDNDANDSNPEFHVIDFDLTVGGVFAAKGRAFESKEDIDKLVSLTSTLPAAYGEFINRGAAPATFTVTVYSSPFALTGPPIGWAVYYNGKADNDPMFPADVEIPFSSVEVFTDQTEPLVTVLGPVISPPVPPAQQPVDIAVTNFGSSLTQDANTIKVVFTFTAGPDDRIRLPDNNLVNAKGIQVNVFSQREKCVDRMNNRARQVISKAAMSDYRCVKAKIHVGGGDATACVDNRADARTNKKETALLTGFAQVCQPLPSSPLPTWGVNGDSCCENDAADDGTPCVNDGDCSAGLCKPGACISYAAESAVNDVIHDLFGGTVMVSSDRSTAVCQRRVTRATSKVLEMRWKVFRRCKKTEFASISDDPSLITTCLGPPQPDSSLTRGKIAKKEAALKRVLGRCVLAGVLPQNEFLGACVGAVDDDAFRRCLVKRIKCRFCLAVNVADDIDPPLDCDWFDDDGDTPLNGSCP